MNLQKEMKKTLETFGKPITLISGDKKIHSVGLFNKLKKNKIAAKRYNPFEKVNSFYKEKLQLWALNYEHFDSINKVIYKNTTFEVLIGKYDEEIGCWRLIIQSESIEFKNSLSH